jgi:hypothetical protein
MSDRVLFMDVILDSLKKKLAQILDPNPEKNRFCIWIMPDPNWPIMKFKQIISPGCPIQPTAQIWPRSTSDFLGLWKLCWEGVHSKRKRICTNKWWTFWYQSRHCPSEQYLSNGKVDCAIHWSKWTVSLKTPLINDELISKTEINLGTGLFSPTLYRARSLLLYNDIKHDITCSLKLTVPYMLTKTWEDRGKVRFGLISGGGQIFTHPSIGLDGSRFSLWVHWRDKIYAAKGSQFEIMAKWRFWGDPEFLIKMRSYSAGSWSSNHHLNNIKLLWWIRWAVF